MFLRDLIIEMKCLQPHSQINTTYCMRRGQVVLDPIKHDLRVYWTASKTFHKKACPPWSPNKGSNCERRPLAFKTKRLRLISMLNILSPIIAELYNTSFKEGYLPTLLKSAVVCPLPKQKPPPCGMPAFKFRDGDFVDPILTTWVLSSRKDATHLSTQGWISLSPSFASKVWWSIKSKPFLKSAKNHLTHTLPRSNASNAKWRRYTIGCWFDLPATANCLVSSCRRMSGKALHKVNPSIILAR